MLSLATIDLLLVIVAFFFNNLNFKQLFKVCNVVRSDFLNVLVIVSVLMVCGICGLCFHRPGTVVLLFNLRYYSVLL